MQKGYQNGVGIPLNQVQVSIFRYGGGTPAVGPELIEYDRALVYSKIESVENLCTHLNPKLLPG